MPTATAKLRVLVIDDSVDNAEAMCALLTVMGCDATAVFSGAQGVAAAQAWQPHLVFIDLEMPGMDGCETVRHLRAHQPAGSTRFICLTGRGHPSDRRTCLDAGFDEFFTKPMAAQSLVALVAALRAAL